VSRHFHDDAEDFMVRALAARRSRRTCVSWHGQAIGGAPGWQCVQGDLEEVVGGGVVLPGRINTDVSKAIEEAH
jgi:hypothetical protein